MPASPVAPRLPTGTSSPLNPQPVFSDRFTAPADVRQAGDGENGPLSRRLLGRADAVEEATSVAAASLPRLAQVRALSVSSTSLRWAPSPVAALPRLGASHPHAPTISSPLRPSTGVNLAPMALLQLGDAVYQRGREHVKTAVNHWLQAMVEAERPAVAEALEQRLTLARRRPRPERALLSLHSAFFTANVSLSRRYFLRAIELDANIVYAAEQLMLCAYQQPALQDVFRPLCVGFAALLPRVVEHQQLLARSMREQNWVEAARLAKFLGDSLPHLLLPRCAKLVTNVVAERSSGSYGAYPALAGAARGVMANVFALDGDGHVHASGRIATADYTMIWQMFLEAWYVVEPTAFGAHYDPYGRLCEPETAQRTVAGLPWHRAMQMPFAGTWREEVVAWRQAEAGAAGAV